MKRYDYVRYDDDSAALQSAFKEEFEKLSGLVDSELGFSREAALTQTKLEEAYMWVGKAIRDAQVNRGGDKQDQPARG